MKLLKVIFLLVFATTLAGTAWSQGANQASGPEILGYLNARSNSFRPMYMQAIGSPAVVSVATGKIVTNFTITVSSAIPSTTPITCNVIASVNEFNDSTGMSGNQIFESATVNATRSAGTAKCSVIIPYSWNLSYRSTDHLGLSYQIDARTCTSCTVTTAGLLVDRLSSQNIATISIPANGATTTETVKATI